MSHLVVVAAGTGGHVMPGLAVAQRLRSEGWTVSWLGTREGLERRLVESSGIDYDALDWSNPRRRGVAGRLAAVPRLIAAVLASRRSLRQRQAAAVFTTGGWIALPAGLAAAWRHVPLALLNADAAPLLSMRLLRPFSRVILCGFAGPAAALGGRRSRITGNPVRPEVASLPPPADRFAGRPRPLRVLVLGGSLGASVLNRLVPLAAARLAAAGGEPAMQIVHQCGAAHVEATREAYRAAGAGAEVLGFLDDVAARYAWADVVVCRAGAITVAELCAAGVASVLVPLLAATTDHQRSNAEFMAQAGAAIHLPQADCNEESLSRILQQTTRAQWLAMALAARALSPPDATGAVAGQIKAMLATGPMKEESA